ncbi:hypothetical protein ABTB41_19895, partial [Acinetobacter baumannii]
MKIKELIKLAMTFVLPIMYLSQAIAAQSLRGDGFHYEGVSGPFYQRKAISESDETRTFRIQATASKNGYFNNGTLRIVLADAFKT